MHWAKLHPINLCQLHCIKQLNTIKKDGGNYILTQYREYTVGSLSSAVWCSMFMQIYAVYLLRPASSAVSLARTCNWLTAIMVMRCVMRHAWRQKLQRFRLKWTYCYSLYCDLTMQNALRVQIFIAEKRWQKAKLITTFTGCCFFNDFRPQCNLTNVHLPSFFYIELGSTRIPEMSISMSIAFILQQR